MTAMNKYSLAKINCIKKYNICAKVDLRFLSFMKLNSCLFVTGENGGEAAPAE
jgi:hypothetical protein